MFYLVNTPFWLRRIFPKDVVWKGDAAGNKVYLSFDDGPTPAVTQFVLDQLREYDYKATFFCIGENVQKHPAIFQQLKDEGHRTGNHTMHHPSGWKTSTEDYVNEIIEANQLIQSDLFRPPYGKITSAQVNKLKELVISNWETGNTNQSFQTGNHSTEIILNTNSTNPIPALPAGRSDTRYPTFSIIMWSVITGDFDTTVNGDTCFNRMKRYTGPGSIIVFHDSEKAFPRLKEALPKTLAWIKQQGLVPAVIG